MVAPARLLLHYLLNRAIKERATRLSYRRCENGGTLHATVANETCELIPLPVAVVPDLLSELARLVSIDEYTSDVSGTFQLANTTIFSFGSWNGDRPITVDVELSTDRFELELTYSDTPVEPTRMMLIIPPA